LLVKADFYMYDFFYKNKDKAVTALIFLVSFIFYYISCIELLSHGFYEKINIAFDLDQSWYFDMVGRDSVDWVFKTASDTKPLLIKHPFIYLYHYPVLILNMIGYSDNVSVIILSQIFHSGSLVLSFLVFRSMGHSTLESSLLTFGLAGTSTYISTGLVLDTYSLVIFWISAIFLILCKSIYQNIECPLWARAFISIMAIGTTSYLIVLVVLMELTLTRMINKSVFNGFFLKKVLKQLLRVFVLGVLLFFIVYYQIIVDIIEDPITVIKRVYWVVNRPGEKQGLFQVLSVFSIFSILSPIVSNILLPEGMGMIDLRVMNYGYIGWISLMIMLFLIVSNLKINKHKPILQFSFLWFIFNVLFHTIYQYRGSLFIYSGHFILAVFIIWIGNGIYSKRNNSILIFIWSTLVWVNNYEMYKEVIRISLV